MAAATAITDAISYAAPVVVRIAVPAAVSAATSTASAASAATSAMMSAAVFIAPHAAKAVGSVAEMVSNAATIATAAQGEVPPHWESKGDGPGTVALGEGSAEWALLVAQFHASCPETEWRVVRVERVEHKFRYQQHELERAHLASKQRSSKHPPQKLTGLPTNGDELAVRWLWHGTDQATAQAIVVEGFNRSHSLVAVYGKGVYFARNASYSVGDTYSPSDGRGRKWLFAARVLVGDVCIGKQQMLVPPTNPATGEKFSCLVDRLPDPSVFCSAHNDNTAYPEYLLVVERVPPPEAGVVAAEEPEPEDLGGWATRVAWDGVAGVYNTAAYYSTYRTLEKAAAGVGNGAARVYSGVGTAAAGITGLLSGSGGGGGGGGGAAHVAAEPSSLPGPSPQKQQARLPAAARPARGAQTFIPTATHVAAAADASGGGGGGASGFNFSSAFGGFAEPNAAPPAAAGVCCVRTTQIALEANTAAARARFLAGSNTSPSV